MSSTTNSPLLTQFEVNCRESRCLQLRANAKTNIRFDPKHVHSTSFLLTPLSRTTSLDPPVPPPEIPPTGQWHQVSIDVDVNVVDVDVLGHIINLRNAA
ncbi:GD14259 [Drosophila simulans]|uniref:GD14259 n=1 Tax=Drosophila simulans TaxID=7240 RepID=B4QP93_DROSI|nr:GD14259 [Drosophila simulans]